VRGLRLEIIGIDCRTALARKTILESRKNCKRSAFGMKLIRVYFAVKIELSQQEDFCGYGPRMINLGSVEDELCISMIALI